jgi:hypothetical protein
LEEFGCAGQRTLAFSWAQPKSHLREEPGLAAAAHRVAGACPVAKGVKNFL